MHTNLSILFARHTTAKIKNEFYDEKIIEKSANNK